MPVALPSAKEQHRIVQKVNELTALCDQLKERLNQASETRYQLSEAVVEGALDEFHPGTQFVDAVHLYLFDKQLRLYLADALERIEISLRVDQSHLLGKRSPFAHIENTKAHFHPGFASRPFHRGSQQSCFDAWLNKYRGLVSRSKEDFVRHYHANHGDQLPIWVAVKVLDFGAISQLFSMLNVRDQLAIANRYGVNTWSSFRSSTHQGSWSTGHSMKLSQRSSGPRLRISPSTTAIRWLSLQLPSMQVQSASSTT